MSVMTRKHPDVIQIPDRRSILFLTGLAALVLAACGGDGAPPEEAHAPGETVDVGGWFPARVLLVEMNGIIEITGAASRSGWTVSVTDTLPCTPAPTGGGEGFICVDLTIANTDTRTGALDLAAALPALVSPSGERFPLRGAQYGDMPFIVVGSQVGTVSASSNCSFSAPDDSGRQAGQCAVMLAALIGEDAIEEGYLSMGGGASTNVRLAFRVPTGGTGTGWILEWPDHTGFTLP